MATTRPQSLAPGLPVSRRTRPLRLRAAIVQHHFLHHAVCVSDRVSRIVEAKHGEHVQILSPWLQFLHKIQDACGRPFSHQAKRPNLARGGARAMIACITPGRVEPSSSRLKCLHKIKHELRDWCGWSITVSVPPSISQTSLCRGSRSWEVPPLSLQRVPP